MVDRRRTARLAIALVLAGPLGWGAWSTWSLWSDHRQAAEALRQARVDVAVGRWDAARDRLADLSARDPGRGDVEFLLGMCEASAGRVDAALAAWGRVPRQSDEAPQAAIRRARLALESGRFAVAERALADAPLGVAAESMPLRLRLWLSTARVDDLRDQFRDDATRDPNPETLNQLWLLDTVPFPIDQVGGLLDKAGRDAPDDDRVWLGRANLARLAGRPDEADAWLARCETRRPDDPAVAHARFLWAMATDRPDHAAWALAKIPETDRRPLDLLNLRGKRAMAKGDTEAARGFLEATLRREPGDVETLEQLTSLVRRSGPPGRLAELLARKVEIDRGFDDYREFMAKAGGPGKGADAAPIAERLGRRFDARIWWELARRQGEPGAAAALARLDAEAAVPPVDRSLAGLAIGSDRPAGSKDTPPAPAITFHDEAESAGLRFVHRSDRSPLRRLPETMSGGVGLLDYDGDGRLDIYAVQGGRLRPDPDTSEPSGGDRLFRNMGDGTFEDTSVASGIAAMPRGYGHGVAVGDYDGDGQPDLFVTRWRSYALYHNKGDGTFEDATDRAGLGGDRDWPTSAAFADLDEDGDLDLYVCHYLAWDFDAPPCEQPSRPGHFYCTPRQFPALADHLFRNDGGRFIDATAEAGIVDRDGRGLGVVAADLDDDGKVDLYVANDMTANALYHNLGGLRFQEVAIASGVGSSGDGGYQAGMGIACGDLDGDGLIDLAVTNFHGESTTFYQDLGRLQFADRTRAVGLALPSRFLLGFGASFLDVDNDGRLDLATANGHVNDFRPDLPYEMPGQLLLGGDRGRLTDVSARAGACWAVPRLGRGLVVGDLDDDGRPDLVVLAQDAPLALFHNDGPAGHWLTFCLEGTASNRDAIGAKVILTAEGRRRVATRFGGGSYQSAGSPRLHFGLGRATRAEAVEVRWPSGRVDSYKDIAADRGYLIREGADRPEPLLPAPQHRVSHL